MGLHFVKNFVNICNKIFRTQELFELSKLKPHNPDILTQETNKEDCTFHPNINKSIINNVFVQIPKDSEKVISRLRKAQDDNKIKQEMQKLGDTFNDKKRHYLQMKKHLLNFLKPETNAQTTNRNNKVD